MILTIELKDGTHEVRSSVTGERVYLADAVTARKVADLLASAYNAGVHDGRLSGKAEIYRELQRILPRVDAVTDGELQILSREKLAAMRADGDISAALSCAGLAAAK